MTKTNEIVAIEKVVPVSEKAISIGTTDHELIKINLDALNKVAKTISQSLIEGVDYGKIPAFKSAKPSLFKPGAEKIYLLFGLIPNYTIIASETAKERVLFQFKCDLTHNGEVKATGVGLASSLEKKWSGAPMENANTILKIAKKRAMVDAVIGIGCLSTIFTQDLEDMSVPKSSYQESSGEQEVSYDDKLRTINEFAKILKLEGWKNKDLVNKKMQEACKNLELSVSSIFLKATTKVDLQKFRTWMETQKGSEEVFEDLPWESEM